MTDKIINDYRGFRVLIGSETCVAWEATGGVRCVAVRDGKRWLLAEGPGHLVGRHWHHLRDLRAAANGGHR